MSLLEKIIRLINILWVNWYGCSLRPTFQLSSSLLDIMKKSKEIFQHLKKNYGLPPLAWFILRTNFQIPKDMIVLLQKYDTTQEGVMYCLLGMNIFWCKKEQISYRTKTKDLVKLLKERKRRNPHLNKY